MRHIVVCWWNYEVWFNMMSLPSGSGCNDGVFITRRELYDTLRQSGRVKLQEQVTVMKDFVRMKTKCTDEYIMALNKQISFFVSDFKKRWQQARRIEERFLEKNKDWLDSSVSFRNYDRDATRKCMGRPTKSFDESSDRTKRQKTENLRATYSSDELSFAAQMSLLSSGKKEYITLSETAAEVNLQALLDHTASRLLEAQKDVFHNAVQNSLKLILICKWGFDGSTQSEYKQTFSSESGCTDSNVFLSSFVPIRLIDDNPDGQGPTVFWQNSRTSSTRYCRPIRFQFQRETANLSKLEQDHIERQIHHLQPFICELDGKQIEVIYNMLFTMIDGKVYNAITGTSSTQRCFLCNLTSKDFNNLEKVLTTEIVDTSRLSFGLSVLHARIRFFECLLHLAYKLPLEKWQARGIEQKNVVSNTKKTIQDRFKKDMGLLVDKPKPGFGNTNDGNTSRRFFENPALSASITGVDIEIIRRFNIILQVISCGHEIDVEKFRNYAFETAQLFVRKYSWKIPKKKAKQFDKEVLDMLRAPDVRSAVHDSSDDSDSANEAEESRC
ncbi:hypothetical protein ANN_19888 [Periplaneta americana]|uniref:Uncharacterized protein n=1 Tax=Periplaneta americana TaxID=6978 RepID=A0ABQ8SB38_PERAM|nr:hypothetical protein ANN_19888 [Periplaneta americana]